MGGVIKLYYIGCGDSKGSIGVIFVIMVYVVLGLREGFSE